MSTSKRWIDMLDEEMNFDESPPQFTSVIEKTYKTTHTSISIEDPLKAKDTGTLSVSTNDVTRR